ncbi:MAG: putative inorganic carbon transporter subunit DabA, partial [Gammaproteobacteria bacterium]
MHMPPADAHATEQQLHEAVAAAARCLPRFFPLDAFVASNPLQGFEDLPFDTAIASARRLCGGHGHRALDEYRARLAAGDLERDRLATAIDAALATPMLSLGGTEHALRNYLMARLEDDTHGREPSGALTAAAAAACQRADLGDDDGGAGWPVEHTTLLAWLDARLDAGLCERRDTLVGAFLQACLLGADGGLRMPGAQRGLYAAYRCHLASDPLLDGVTAALELPRAALLPDAPESAVLGALAALGLGGERRADYVRQQLFALKGWAAFVAWYESTPRAREHPAGLLDLLAVLLVTERLLWLDLALASGLPCDLHGLVAHLPHPAGPVVPPAAHAIAAFAACHALTPATLERASATELVTLATTLATLDDSWLALRCLEAEEHAYRDTLLAQLATPPVAPPPAGRPRAQVAFCIDVRSEPMRRALEAHGGYETCGYAGFFGVAVSYARLDGSVSTHCPVLLEPAHGAHEQASPGLPARARQRLTRRARFAGLLPALRRALKRHPLATFGVVEGFGLLAVWPLVRDAVRPAAPPPRVPADHVPALGGTDAAPLPALDDEEQFAVARSFFATTGLAAPFARLIVLCGHAASTTNNAYAAALDCGACGGHEGGTNARLLARILERRSMRRRLAAHGIALPEDTSVVAALHDTTTDRVTLFDAALPAEHARDLASLRR